MDRDGVDIGSDLLDLVATSTSTDFVLFLPRFLGGSAIFCGSSSVFLRLERLVPVEATDAISVPSCATLTMPLEEGVTRV